MRYGKHFFANAITKLNNKYSGFLAKSILNKISGDVKDKVQHEQLALHSKYNPIGIVYKRY